jgi:hypothetical protein
VLAFQKLSPTDRAAFAEYLPPSSTQGDRLS